MKTKFQPFSTALIGSWPRSKTILKAQWEQHHQHISSKDYQNVIATETKRVIQLQDRLGLDVIVSGEIGRDNYCSFIADHIGGVALMSMSDIVEYIDDKKSFEDILSILDVPSISINNAICVGRLEYHPIALEELRLLKENTHKSVKITLPGPYLLTRSMWIPQLSKAAYPDKETLGAAVVSILQKEIDNLQQLGVDIIQFDEPVLTEVVFTEGKPRSFMCAALSEKKDPSEELEFAKSLLAPVLGHVDKSKSIASLHVCRGNWSNKESILLTGPYTPLLNVFKNINADMLTLEFSTPRAGDLGAFLQTSVLNSSQYLGLGVENPRTSTIEQPTAIIQQVQAALQYLQKQQLFLNPDCGFATFANRPVNQEVIIKQKICSLVKAAQELRQQA